MIGSLNPNRIVNMASVFYESCVLFVASDLGVFQKLAELGHANAPTLAEHLKLDDRGLRLLLDACAALSLVAKEGEMYENTPETATFLVPGKPGDLSNAIRYNRDVYPAWGRLAELIRTGNPVEKQKVHLGEDKDRTYNFVLAMHGRAKWIGRALLPLLNLTGRKKLLDIGGGSGAFSTLIAAGYPEITCTVMDLPDVVEIAGYLIERDGMKDRVRTLAGNYHRDPFPSENDVVNILGVLHQESPESIQNILEKAYDALEPGGIIHIMDVMTDASHTAPKFSALFAVNMALTAQDGWVFSDAELSGWLTNAGFHGIEIKPLPPPVPHWLVSAHKA